MALNTPGIATDVAALSVVAALASTGFLTIKDLGAEPIQVEARDCPILFPDPDGFVGSSSVVRKTFGGAQGAYWEELQPLTWRLLYTQVGAERSLAQFTRGMMTVRDALVTALIEGPYTNSGADVRGISITQYGTVAAPNEARFFGFLIQVTFWQQIHP